MMKLPERSDGNFFVFETKEGYSSQIAQRKYAVKVDDYSHFFLFVFLRDQNSQHFDEDLLAVNAFSFVLCFEAINCAGASNYALIAN